MQNLVTCHSVDPICRFVCGLNIYREIHSFVCSLITAYLKSEMLASVCPPLDKKMTHCYRI